MALKVTRSKKCPVCIGCTEEKIKEIDLHLDPFIDEIRETGEVPKPKDVRFQPIAHTVGISPYSLCYHLRSCRLETEIQDQKLVELKSLIEALSTAKQEYFTFPNDKNAKAYEGLLQTFITLANDIDGQSDPEGAVQFTAESVLSPLVRILLSTMAAELRKIREVVNTLIAPTQKSYLASQVDASMARMSSALREQLDESMANLCSYYKVELEAKERKRALDASLYVRGEEPDGQVH